MPLWINKGYILYVKDGIFCYVCLNCDSESLNHDTKILAETHTNTFFWYQIFLNRNRNFFPRPNFLKPNPGLFYGGQILWNRNRYSFPRPNSPKLRLYSLTKFSKTETFFRDQILRNRYQNPPKIGKSLKTETETETFQYPCKFLELSSIFLLFLL